MDPLGKGAIESSKLNAFLEQFAQAIVDANAGKTRSERQKFLDKLGMDVKHKHLHDIETAPLAFVDDVWRAKIVASCVDQLKDAEGSISFSFVLRSLVQERLGSAFVQLKERLQRTLQNGDGGNDACVICQLHNNS